jgi:RimJ/RimL family protein N-acetyltransferase
MKIEKDITLTDGRVWLRFCRMEDAQEHYNAVRESIAELSMWAGWANDDFSLDDSHTWLKACSTLWDKGAEYNFAITQPQTKVIMGWCGLNRIDYQNMVANLGYWVRKKYCNNGIASSAAILLAKFGFEKLHFNRIEIVAATGNKASQRVAEKTGATREGILRNLISVHGKIHDGVMFSLTPGDILGEKKNASVPQCPGR